MKRWISLLMVIMLCSSYSLSLSEDLVGEEIVILDEGTETSFDEIGLEISDDFDIPFEEMPEEIDLLDADLLALEPQTSMDSIETDDVVSNSVQGNYGVDLESEGYVTNINPFYRKNYWGECTWYCWGRAYEKCGLQLSWSTNDVFGNAKEWYNNAKAWADTHDVDYSVGTEPKANSIAVSTYGDFGHVVFIEKIENGQVFYSESNGDGGYHAYGEGSKPLSNLPYVGYIYLRGVVASGQCGDNVYWDLYEDKVLEIHGSGAMWDWDYEKDAPWKQYSNDELEESQIDKVIIDAGVTTIGDFAFDCSGVRVFSIPDTVNHLGKYSFNYCYNLHSISLPDDIECIAESAFFESAIADIKLPQKLKIIESYAFGRTDKLTSCSFPEGLQEIRSDAFFEGNLESITIPASVDLIDSRAFDRCDNLATIKVNKNNSTYCAKSNVLYTKEMDMLVFCAPKKTGKFVVPDGIIYLGKLAFGGSKLSHITLPDGLKAIGDLAFHGAFDLVSVNIPSSVETISETAFLGWSPDGGLLDKLTVYAPYGNYAHKYCRSQDARHNKDGFIKNYIITLYLSKTGSNGKVTLKKGEKLQLNPVSNKGNLTIKSCKTGNSKVAKISNKGVVTAVGKGETKITVQPKGTKAMTLTVKVEDPYTPTGVKLNKSGTVKLAIGKTLQLKATVSPDTAETTLTWSSSNSKIAKVSKNGKVTGLKKGTATITVKTKNGKTAKVKIKVEKGSGGGGGGGGW